MKWIIVWINAPLVALNLVLYVMYGNPLNLGSAIFCGVVGAIGFISCSAIENAYRGDKY